MGKLIDLTGKRFGSWTVLERHPENYQCDYETHTVPQWICRCDCGTVSVVLGNNLRSGASTCCRKCREDKRMVGLRESRRVKSYKRHGGSVYGY